MKASRYLNAPVVYVQRDSQDRPYAWCSRCCWQGQPAESINVAHGDGEAHIRHDHIND
jgi:hypothetical protein